MNLNITYDANTLKNAPSAFFTDVNYVVNLFDTTFTNNATVNIEIGYGNFPYDNSVVPALGESLQNNLVYANYSHTLQQLTNEGAPGVNTLFGTAPISGSLVMASAQQKALGLIGASSSLDGWVGIASDATVHQQTGGSWSFSPTATPGPNQYYLVGTLEHEITEVMGRTSYLDVPGEYGVMDLYRYAAPNVHTEGSGYFSVDNGATNLDAWNTLASGDIGDWAGSAGADAFDAFSSPGLINGLTATDITLIRALGWGSAPLLPQPQPTAQPSSPGSGVVADFNSDGKADILIQNADTGQLNLWEMNGTGITAAGGIYAPGPSWEIRGASDFNGDGKPDILLQNSDTSQINLWEMNGYNIIGAGGVYAPGPSWHVQATADFNGDGKADILVQNTDTGQVNLWEMDGPNIIAASTIYTPGPSWKVAGAADFNGDGKADIVLQNTDTGQVNLWEMNGTDIIAAGSISNPGPSWAVKGIGDFNGDGKPDILLQNAATSQVSIWEMDGYSIIGGGSVYTPGAGWEVRGAGDFNGDRKADILLQNTGSGQVNLWEMNGTSIAGAGGVYAPGSSWHIPTVT